MARSVTRNTALTAISIAFIVIVIGLGIIRSLTPSEPTRQLPVAAPIQTAAMPAWCEHVGTATIVAVRDSAKVEEADADEVALSYWIYVVDPGDVPVPTTIALPSMAWSNQRFETGRTALLGVCNYGYLIDNDGRRLRSSGLVLRLW